MIFTLKWKISTMLGLELRSAFKHLEAVSRDTHYTPNTSLSADAIGSFLMPSLLNIDSRCRPLTLPCSPVFSHHSLFHIQWNLRTSVAKVDQGQSTQNINTTESNQQISTELNELHWCFCSIYYCIYFTD